jgi:hypothetical protein
MYGAETWVLSKADELRLGVFDFDFGVLMYGAETWVLSKADELRLGVFERKTLRRIYGSICKGATCRSRYNDELYRLYDETDFVTTVRITRLRWVGHIV